jgi:hypothetical protein
MAATAMEGEAMAAAVLREDTSPNPGPGRCRSGLPRSRTRRFKRSTSLATCECPSILRPASPADVNQLRRLA